MKLSKVMNQSGVSLGKFWDNPNEISEMDSICQNESTILKDAIRSEPPTPKKEEQVKPSSPKDHYRFIREYPAIEIAEKLHFKIEEKRMKLRRVTVHKGCSQAHKSRPTKYVPKIKALRDPKLKVQILQKDEKVPRILSHPTYIKKSKAQTYREKPTEPMKKMFPLEVEDAFEDDHSSPMKSPESDSKPLLP